MKFYGISPITFIWVTSLKDIVRGYQCNPLWSVSMCSRDRKFCKARSQLHETSTKPVEYAQLDIEYEAASSH